MEYFTDTSGKGYCKYPDTEVYCETTAGAYRQYCYNSAGKKCATITYMGTIDQGVCTDPGCPEGFEYGYVSGGGGYYGCVNKNTGVSCQYHAYAEQIAG